MKCGTLNKQLSRNNWICGILTANPVMGWRFAFANATGKEAIMEVQVCVRNLSSSTTQTDLDILFEQAGDVTAIHIIKDRKTGESRGFAYITMSAQSEADKAVSMFNAFVLDDHFLKVDLVRPREQRGFDRI